MTSRAKEGGDASSEVMQRPLVDGQMASREWRGPDVCVWVCDPERCPAAAYTRATAAYHGRALGPLGGRYCGLCRMCAVGRGFYGAAVWRPAGLCAARGTWSRLKPTL